MLSQEELDRREQSPTAQEQVEDCLCDVLDAVVRRTQRFMKKRSAQGERERRRAWHPATM